MTGDELSERVRSLEAERARPMARWHPNPPGRDATISAARRRIAQEIARTPEDGKPKP